MTIKNKRKPIWLYMAVMLFLVASARGWNADEVDFVGEVQGWDLGSVLSAKYTGPDGFSEWFRYVTPPAVASSGYGFKMVVGNNWSNDYGGGVPFPKNEIGLLTFQPVGDLPAQLDGGSVAGKRYIFTARDPGLNDTFVSVMEISGAPTPIVQVSGPDTNMATGSTLQFNVTLASPPHPEERVFIRVSRDGFATWNIYEAAIAGNIATLSIPNASPQTMTWYAFTSTATLATLQVASSFAIDALTLSWINNGGANYAVTISGPGEAAWIWHANNRTAFARNDGFHDVQLWAKTGYINSDGTLPWVNRVSLYYTTDGVTPATGSQGVPDTGVNVAEFSFQRVEQDESSFGDAAWWSITIPAVPDGVLLRYRIGAWHDQFNQPERFADFRTNMEMEFSFTPGVGGGLQSLRVNGLPGEYTTSKGFLDERAGDIFPIEVSIDLSGVTNLDPTSVEVFTNLGRRQYADNDWDNDGIPDGVKFPDFSAVTVANAESPIPSYFRPYPMTPLGGQQFAWSTNIVQCGVYRISGRYRLLSDAPTTWRWFLERDLDGNVVFPEARQLARAHSVVLSPSKSLDMTLYEINTLTVEATDNTFQGRSTFNDLLGPPYDNDGFDPFNLEYIDSIGINCLWFQPIHPNGKDPRTLFEGYEPGSPYATRDYFAVSGNMGSDGTESGAMAEFTNFVAYCDAHTGTVGTINVMLDFVANHTSWDAVFGAGGADLFGLDPARRIAWDRPQWYARNNNYCLPATYYNTEFDNDIAVAPDRGDFGKWRDTAELYFGQYASLVCQNPFDNASYLNEGDWVNFLSMTPSIAETWRFIGYYPEFWIRKSGHPGHNNDPAADDLGVDAFRCDFGQGLPPQLWEYVINRTRHVKWNTVFMAETLDGGIPGYRSNRHFDILNENLVFQFTQAKVNDSSSIRTALEDRRQAYNGGAILLNITSHDEVLPDNDAWLNASRFAALSSVDGLPMIFYGQEQGIQNYQATPGFEFDDGFLTVHELNFGKYVPHFKQWNKLLIWEYPPPNSAGMAAWYGRVNRARLGSPALRARNRWFLNPVGGGSAPEVFAVAKYETATMGPRQSDIVLAFSLLLPHGAPHNSSARTFDLRGAGDALWNNLGLRTNATYSVVNLASTQPSAYLPGWPRTGQDLYDNGIFVNLPGDIGQPIDSNGALVQYLRLLELCIVDISSIIRASHGVDIQFNAEPSWSYTIEFSDDFATAPQDPSWQTFVSNGSFTQGPVPGLHTFHDDFSANSSGLPPPSHGQRVYRIRCE